MTVMDSLLDLVLNALQTVGIEDPVLRFCGSAQQPRGRDVRAHPSRNV